MEDFRESEFRPICQFTNIQYVGGPMERIKTLRKDDTSKSITDVREELLTVDKLIGDGIWIRMDHYFLRGRNEKFSSWEGDSAVNWPNDHTQEDLEKYKYMGLITYDYINFEEEAAAQERMENKTKYNKANEWYNGLTPEDKEMVDILTNAARLSMVVFA